MDEHEVELLVRAAQSGDRSALDELLRYCRPLLLERAGWCGALPLQLVEAEDLVQKTLVIVANRLAGCEWRGRAAFHGWLNRFLARQIADWRRGQTRDRRDVRRTTPQASDDPDDLSNHALSQLPDPLPIPVDEVIRREMEERLTRAVQGLPGNQRQVLHLHYQEGLRLDVVAERLKLDYGYVRNLHSQALQTLRKKL